MTNDSLFPILCQLYDAHLTGRSHYLPESVKDACLELRTIDLLTCFACGFATFDLIGRLPIATVRYLFA